MPWITLTAPVATSTTETCAARQMPLTSKNAMRLPSGEKLAPCRLCFDMSQLAVLASGHVAEPQLKVVPAFIRGVDQLATVGRPGWIGIEKSVVRDVLGLAANRHDPDIA